MVEMFDVRLLPYAGLEIYDEESIPAIQMTKTIQGFKQDSKITSKEALYKKISSQKRFSNKFQGIEKLEIISQIEDSVGANLDYRLWEIGITTNPLYRKNQLAGRGNNVHFWKQWRCKSHQEALEIKQYFIDKGMAANAGDRKNAIHIYIF